MQALSAAALPLPLFLRDSVYDQVADNRFVLVCVAESSCRFLL